MDGIFSSAYCVISACSARGQSDGFLKHREREREYLTFERDGLDPLYVCDFVDNFNHDVLDSNLCHRGWVLQERALARRTIYFTNAQTYWECGDGVRCQSLTKMDNKLASFLGDPNFPSKLSGDNSLRGEKILFYEDLYRQYSRLNFTRLTDRPIAIAGLQRRLIRDLRARGGLGVFDDGRSLLQHSLLWQRGAEVPKLTRIDYSSGGNTGSGTNKALTIPSWSWMAYAEGIDFLDLPLGDVTWLPREIISPWADGPAEGDSLWLSEGSTNGFLEISVRARDFRADQITQDGDVYSIFRDVPDPTRTEDAKTMCVLMGKVRDRGKPDKQLVHCVLFVGPRGVRTPRGEQPYERVGVGFLTGRFIDLDTPGMLVKMR